MICHAVSNVLDNQSLANEKIYNLNCSIIISWRSFVAILEAMPRESGEPFNVPLRLEVSLSRSQPLERLDSIELRLLKDDRRN